MGPAGRPRRWLPPGVPDRFLPSRPVWTLARSCAASRKRSWPMTRRWPRRPRARWWRGRSKGRQGGRHRRPASAAEPHRRLAGDGLGSDGTWLVELAGLRDDRLLPLVALDVLGVAEERP